MDSSKLSVESTNDGDLARQVPPRRSVGWMVAILGAFVAVASASLFVHRTRHTPMPPHERTTVSLPHLELASGENIQSLKMEIRMGRVVSVNRLLDDWDIELAWDHPGLLNLEMTARHFISGLRRMNELDGFITVESSGADPVRLTAVLSTDSTTPSGQAPREIVVPHADFVLKPVLHSNERN